MLKTDNGTLQTIGTALVLALSQALPSSIGYPIVSAIAWSMGNRVLDPAYQSVRINQWVAHDGKLSRNQLRKAVRQVYQHQGRALYDFYHNLDRPSAIRKLVKLSPKFLQLVEECKSGKLKQGTMLLMPHLSGFNLGGLRLAEMGFTFLTLAIPNPNAGYAWQNQLRNDRGMEVLPMTISSMQLARQRLQNGGVVLTGIDRPHDGSGYEPLFFNRPTSLPVAYIKLAQKTKARIFVVGFRTLSDHSYLVEISDQIFLETCSDVHQEIIQNAQKILHEAEEFIRLDPTQWMMFLPVWPQLKREIP